MEYCCHIWAGAPSCYLELLDKLQKRICTTVGPSLATSLDPLAHRRNVTSLSLFYRYYFGRCSSELAQLVDKLQKLTAPRTAGVWRFLPTECFPLTYDLSGLKSRINRYLLTVGSFETDFLYALNFLCFVFL